MDTATRTRFSSLWLLLLLFVGISGWLWYDRGTTDLTVNGEATIKAVPDQYIFSPSYQEKGTDEATAREKVTQVGNGVVEKLRGIGVADGMMSSSVSVQPDYSYGFPVPTADSASREAPQAAGYVGTYSLTITVNELALAQKVQEYLATTPVTGLVTPTSTFKDATRQKLERDARKLALEDAKAQAEDTASTLGVSIRGIESIGQPGWGGPIMPLGIDQDRATSATAPAPEFASPNLLVGEQEISYQIQVVYRVR